MEYTKRFHDGESVECHCCGYPAPLTELQPRYPSKRIEPWLMCEICTSTFFSYCVTFPEAYGENMHLWASLGWIANHLLETIKLRELS
jgi:hypothetical protein